MNQPPNTSTSKSARSARSARYRPVLNQEDVAYLTSLLKDVYVSDIAGTYLPEHYTSVTGTAILTRLIQKFSTLKTKIDNKAIVPEYMASTAPTKEQKEEQLLYDLGEPLPPGDSGSETSNRNARWKAAYDKWCINPTECTLQEIDDVQEYRYLNDLMSPEEIEEMDRAALSKVTNKNI